MFNAKQPFTPGCFREWWEQGVGATLLIDRLEKTPTTRRRKPSDAKGKAKQSQKETGKLKGTQTVVIWEGATRVCPPEPARCVVLVSLGRTREDLPPKSTFLGPGFRTSGGGCVGRIFRFFIKADAM